MSQDYSIGTTNRSESPIGALLHGQVPLKYAVWGYGVAGTIILAFPINFINAAGIQIPSGSPGQAWLLSYCVFLLAYAALTAVGIWRAASRYDGFFFWPLLSKLSVVIVAAAIVLAFLVGLLA